MVAVVEYPEGAAFPGVIGRTTDESSPAWPAPIRARKGAPNVLFVVLDDTGFGQLGCYGSPIATPNFDALAAGGLRFNNMHTTALCSPSRSCIVTGRNHHSNGMACITELASGYPGYDGVVPFENGFLSEMLLDHGYNTFMVGKWHLTPSNQETAAGPYTAGRWHAASSASTAFSAATRASGIRTSSTTTTRSSRRRRPRRATTSPPTSSTSRSSSSPTPSRSTPTSPSTCTSVSGPRTPRITCPRSGPTSTRGSSTTAGMPTARRCSHGRRNSASCPPTPSSPATIPTFPTGARYPTRRAGSISRMMEVFAGFLSHTDHHLGRLLDFLRAEGQLDNTIVMVISDNGASAEGGPTGTTNEAQFFNNAQEPLEESLKVIDEIGGPKHFNHYPWGWTWAGNTPFRRWKRETYRGGACDPFIVSWPKGIKAAGRGAHPVRAHHRHGADRPGPARPRAAGHDQGRHAVALARRQLRPRPERRRRPRRTITPSTSRCSAIARSITTAGGPSAPGRGRRSPRRACRFGAADLRRRRSPSSTPPAGSSTTSTRTSPRTTTSPRRTATSSSP